MSGCEMGPLLLLYHILAPLPPDILSPLHSHPEYQGCPLQLRPRSSAAMVFADKDVKVTSEGRPYLEAALGTEEQTQSSLTDKVQQWARELEQLATIA